MVRDGFGRYEDRFFSTVFLGSGLLFLAMMFVSMSLAAGLVAANTAVANPSAHAEMTDFAKMVVLSSSKTYAVRMAAVLQYLDAFNNGDPKAMAATCAAAAAPLSAHSAVRAADPMQILDGMSPHVWQGPAASEDWWRDVLSESEHLGASGYRITLGEPRHIDVTGDYAYVVVPATMSFNIRGKQVTQSGSVWTVALRKGGTDWPAASSLGEEDYRQPGQRGPGERPDRQPRPLGDRRYEPGHPKYPSG